MCGGGWSEVQGALQTAAVVQGHVIPLLALCACRCHRETMVEFQLRCESPQPSVHSRACARDCAHVSVVNNATHASGVRPDPLQHLTIAQVAELLAVSPRSAWKLIEIGELRRTRIGGATRVARREVERFVESHAG